MCVALVGEDLRLRSSVCSLRVLGTYYELLVAMGFFPAGVQDESLKESQRLAS